MSNRNEHVTEKAINLLKNIDFDEFMRQKNWIYEQVCILTPSGEDAARFPQGILTMMDNIQDFCENELEMDFSYSYLKTGNDTEKESDSITRENTK